MRFRHLGRRPVAVAGVATLVATVVAGCGSSSSSSSAGGGGGATSNASIAAAVPQAIRSKGTLTVAADASYPPNEFLGTDNTTVQGMDADLAQALGQVMGLKVNVTNVTFDAILPGLASGKYDLGMSSFTDTKDREKTVDFVTYFSAGTSFYVKSSGGASIASLDDLCGHKAAVEKGTTQADDATAQDAKCKSANKGGVDVQVYTDQNGANTAITSGRADVGMADSPVAAYVVKQANGAFKLSGQPYGTAPYGIAVPKGNGVAQPLLDALKVLMQNGTYKSILAKYGIEAGAIDSPKINGAES